MPAPKTITMLTNLSTLEVSSVKRAANRGRFAVTKSESPMSKDALKAVLATPAEGEVEYIATLKSAGADEARIEAATAMYRMRKGFADVLKPEDLGVTVTVKAQTKPDGDDDEEEELPATKRAKKSKSQPTAKSADAGGTELAPELESKLEAVMKTNDGLVKANESLAKQVREIVEKSEDQAYAHQAEREFAHVPGSAQELAKTLKAAHAAGPEVEKTILAQLKMTEEVVAKSALLGDLGSTGGGGPASGSAYGKIEALAAQLTMKADNGREMTQAQKVTYVTSRTAEGRRLYSEYLTEHDRAVRNR